MEVDDSPRAIVKLKSSDSVVLTCDKNAILLSNTIKEMLESLSIEDDDSVLEIPVPNVDSNTLKKVITWIEHWKASPQPTNEDIKDKVSDSIDPWDEEYLQIELNQLYNLISAANYLNIPQLLWLTTRKIAYMIKGKSPEDIRNLFGIDNDWSPGELEQIQKENQWCEEK